MSHTSYLQEAINLCFSERNRFKEGEREYVHWDNVAALLQGDKLASDVRAATPSLAAVSGLVMRARKLVGTDGLWATYEASIDEAAHLSVIAELAVYASAPTSAVSGTDLTSVHCPMCDSGLILSVKEVDVVCDLSKRLEVSPAKLWHMALAVYQKHVLGEPNLGSLVAPEKAATTRETSIRHQFDELGCAVAQIETLSSENYDSVQYLPQINADATALLRALAALRDDVFRELGLSTHYGTEARDDRR